jgi:hypothetical protein
MQHVADWVRAGYACATSGTVAMDRAPAFARKMRDLYLVHLGKDQRYRRKRQRLGNAALVLWQHDRAAAELTFVLLVTPGRDHPAHRLESNLRDVTERRGRVVLDAYELVRVTRPGTAAGKVTWTWRLTAEHSQRWRDRFADAIRRRDFVGLRQAWWSLHRMPGFAPIRAQARELRRFANAEWHRSMGGAPFPCRAAKLWYVQREPLDAVRLSAICARRSLRVPTK